MDLRSATRARATTAAERNAVVRGLVPGCGSNRCAIVLPSGRPARTSRRWAFATCSCSGARDGHPPTSRLAGLRRVFRAYDLEHYRGSYDGRVPSSPHPPLAPTLAGDGLAAVVIASVAGSLLYRRRPRT